MHAGPNTPRRRRHRSPLALATAALATAVLATAAFVPSATASRLPAAATTGGPTAAVSQTANTASMSSQLKPVTLPGLTGSEYTVTLPTGDQLKLTGTGSGRYTVSTIPTPGASPMVGVRAAGDARGTTSITAQPTNAIGLLNSGLVDRQLFDVKWLIDHGDTGPAARLPITIEYPGQTAATFTANAAALPGATVIGTSGSTVSLTVAADQASAFWAALTGHTGEKAATPAWAARAELTGGAARIWLTGHQAGAVPADGQPMQAVTVIEKKAQGPAFYCNFILVTICTGGPMLARVSSTGLPGYLPTSAGCVDQNPCTTQKFTYTVPTGVYEAQDNGSFYVAKNRWHFMWLADPQFTVAGDTSLTFDADNTVPVSIDTPRPSEAYDGAFESNRTAADGSYSASLTFTAYGYSNFEALPTTKPVTIGTYNFSTVWLLGKPPVTMSVDSPQSLTLHPTYPGYTNIDPTRWFARFSGRQKLPLVSAGYGTAQDFAGIDVRGKLALIRVHYGDFLVYTDQLRNALNAGAAGVIIDPTDYEFPGFDSPLPIYPAFDPGRMNIPFASITSADVAQLNKLLAAGPVNVDVADGGTTSYLYSLKFSEEEKVPASMHYTLADRQLARVTTNYHASQASTIDQIVGAWLPHEFFTAATEYPDLTAPTSRINYYGPITPDLVWLRTTERIRPDFSFRLTADVFDHADSRTEQWFDQPGAPGAFPGLPDVLQAQPGKWTGINSPALCSFCRQGNTLYPFFYMTAGSNPRLRDGAYTFDPNLLHLYREDGTEVPQSKDPLGNPVYELPASAGRYRLTAGTDFSWTFTSSRPAQDAPPQGAFCVATYFGSTDPCAADPLLFLRYNAFTDLNNAVTASSSHRLRITPYYQADTAPAKVTTLKVWTSTDGGKTWQQAALDKDDEGNYTAHYQVPALSATDGHVSIKAEASDSAGGTLAETLTDAYSLTARTP